MSRRRWISAWIGFTVLASIVLLVVGGFGVGLGAVSGAAGPAVVGEVLLATLAFLPPCWWSSGWPQPCSASGLA
ncbi:hypothetical protein [Kribbella endophytica]